LVSPSVLRTSLRCIQWWADASEWAYLAVATAMKMLGVTALASRGRAGIGSSRGFAGFPPLGPTARSCQHCRGAMALEPANAGILNS
jgi:hypothetical protein